jgi:hypothetical protein
MAPEQNEEGEAEGVGAEVVEGTLAREWELEGNQLRDHLPGSRVVGEEATVPGRVDARDRVDSTVSTGEELPQDLPASVFPSPADHIAQGHCC